MKLNTSATLVVLASLILAGCSGGGAGLSSVAEACPVEASKSSATVAGEGGSTTPSGVRVDEVGCPIDSDGDDVLDYLDQCCCTRAGVPVDGRGGAPDSDFDAVSDHLDDCSDTRAGVEVDAAGCPLAGEQL